MKPVQVITIDGPAASGKSTTARAVASRLGWSYIDTGAMYRALGLAALRAGVDPSDEPALPPVIEHADVRLIPGIPVTVLLNDEDVTELIRTPEVSDAASRISVHSFVRRLMANLQRNLGLAAPSVLEGRDTGTVVIPEAGLKVFLVASIEERTRRRVRDYETKGIKVDPVEVSRDLAERDHRDTNRADSPLVQAPDAIPLDTTGLTIEGQVGKVLELAYKRFDGLPV